MLGHYRVDRKVLRFEPQFPLETGMTYRAVFSPERLTGPQTRSHLQRLNAVFQTQPRGAAATTEVFAVFPSARVLPENLLKFYVHFSAPMNRGRVYDHITLRNSAGNQIELPFLEIGEELWGPGMTRLTLLIDPGRIKRGVLPLEEVGSALEEGQSYSLIISRELRDSQGNLLKGDFEKPFRVGPADRDPPDPSSWRIAVPVFGTRHPLQITFPESMDSALALRVILVTSESGRLVSGKTALQNEERLWTFAPTTAWRRGSYQVVIQTTIEDLSGNNIGRPFDVDLFEGVQKRLATESVKIPFQVR